MNLFFKTFIVPVVFISLFAIVSLSNITPKLGLDLQGGISVLLTADDNSDEDLINQAVEIMRSRIEDFGDVKNQKFL